MAEVTEQVNSISDLKKFFTPDSDKGLSSMEFKAEWDKLSDAEKAWFKTQPLR